MLVGRASVPSRKGHIAVTGDAQCLLPGQSSVLQTTLGDRALEQPTSSPQQGSKDFALELGPSGNLGPSCHPLTVTSLDTPKVRIICKAFRNLFPSYGLETNPRLITCRATHLGKHGSGQIWGCRCGGQ